MNISEFFGITPLISPYIIPFDEPGDNPDPDPSPPNPPDLTGSTPGPVISNNGTTSGNNSDFGNFTIVYGPGLNPKAFLPIYVVTAFYGAIFIIGPLIVRKRPNAEVYKCSIMLTSFCLWIFWLTIYTAQINPLVGPTIDNHCLAWVGEFWGNKPGRDALGLNNTGSDNDTESGNMTRFDDEFEEFLIN